MPNPSPTTIQAPVVTHRRAACIALAAILIVAAAVRMSALTQAPPGLNQDEAVNAWNAWCLLKTGRDQAGAAWPIFCMRELGGYRSTLYMYATLAFQVFGGLNVWTTRLPGAVSGVLAVGLLYYVLARLIDRPTGLMGAALLALNPWSIFINRLGHEAAICPLLTVLPLAALLWAGLPLGDHASQPRWWRALVAGLVIGGCCYGYAATRLFLPPFLIACVGSARRAVRQMARTRAGAGTLGALLLGLALTLGPLAREHVAHPDQIGKRAQGLWVWQPEDSWGLRAAKVLQRYALHYGPSFLFAEGDLFKVEAVAGFGQYSWYTAPLMIVGLAAALRMRRTSIAARVILCSVLLYPIGDCLFQHGMAPAADKYAPSPHALRSAPGLVGPIMLAAVGAVTAGQFLWQRRRRTAFATIGVFVAVALFLDARFVTVLFGENNRRDDVYHGYLADLVEACAWLRPRLAQIDAVFITTDNMNMPYIVALVVLQWDPAAWFAGPNEVRKLHGWEHYARVGKLRFLYDQTDSAGLEELRGDERRDRVILIVRPSEARSSAPVHAIYRPDGAPALLIFDMAI